MKTIQELIPLTEIRAEAENLRDCDLKEEYRPKLYF